MICWYCHWGWPKPVAEIYLKALKLLNGQESPLHFGPAHVVWEDENFELAESCLEDFDEFENYCDYSDYELSIVRQSLEELAKLPVHVRCVEPEDYDGKHPELYPPPDGVEMIKGL